MTFAAKDTKLLWGRASGRCSNPGCRKKLTADGADGQSFLTGEMAHKIAQSPTGPRGGPVAGADTYDNLILLCPSCHRDIDKAPDGTYPLELLKVWKQTHEAWVNSWSDARVYETVHEMAADISKLLHENHMHFKEYGPKSEIAQKNPGSSAHAIWVARKLDTILPNNCKISKILGENSNLLPNSLTTAALRFKMHAAGFENNQYERVEYYPLFPAEFYAAIEELSR